MPTTTTPDPRRWWTLAALAVSLLVLSVDNTILNVALPTIQNELHASAGALQWIVDSYLVVFAGLLLTMGSLGDRFGRKKALMTGLVIFGSASAAAAFADSTTMLIAARATMGIGGALIMPATLSIITNVFPADERGKAIGIWAGVFGLGIAIGPVTGGALLDSFDWGAIFLVNVPIVVIALIACTKLVRESRDPEPQPIDLPGAALSVAGLTTLIYAVIHAPDHGWLSAQTLIAFAIASGLLAAFGLWERRSAHPMLDLSVFSNARFSAASAALTLGSFSLFGAIFYLTQHLQGVLGYSPLEAGLRLLPVAGGLMLSAPLSSVVARKLGARVAVTAGMSLVGIGLGLIVFADQAAGYGPVVLSMVVMAVGMGTAMAAATESIMSSLPPARAGVGSAMNDAVRMVGGSLGVAVLGSVLSSGYRGGMDGAPHAAQDSLGAALSLGNPAVVHQAVDAFVNGMHAAALAAAAVALTGAIVAALFLPGRARRERITAAVPEAAAA